MARDLLLPTAPWSEEFWALPVTHLGARLASPLHGLLWLPVAAKILVLSQSAKARRRSEEIAILEC